MVDVPDDYWDEYGRGPMVREFHRRCGFDPAHHAAGFSSWAKAMKHVREDRPEWPVQFRAMLLAVVRSVLDEERAAARADAETWIEVRMRPVREAYTALLERVKRLEAGGGRPPETRVRPPRPAMQR